MAATLSLVHRPVKPGRLRCNWASARKLVDAPTLITCGSPAGLPTVPLGPASPLAVTTVTPAATAAWLASDSGSLWRSGNGLLPSDSFMTSTLSTVTAYSTPCTIWAVVACCEPATFIAARDAPGATPLIRMVQPAGSGEAGFTKAARS
jgi:hypothetical protein